MVVVVVPVAVLAILLALTALSLVGERGSPPKRGRHSTIFCPPSASVLWQPDMWTVHINRGFLGAGFLGAPPISLLVAAVSAYRVSSYICWPTRWLQILGHHALMATARLRFLDLLPLLIMKLIILIMMIVIIIIIVIVIVIVVILIVIMLVIII